MARCKFLSRRCFAIVRRNRSEFIPETRWCISSLLSADLTLTLNGLMDLGKCFILHKKVNCNIKFAVEELSIDSRLYNF